MAELIWQAADPKAAGHVATYDSGGARVEVHREAPDGTRGKAVPKWVSVGLGLMEKRIREYRDETGRLPSQELLSAFQKEMGKRLDAYIKEPLKHPFRPMGLREFELRVES
ncbi:MAG: hypothetical protein IKH57_21335 [Clostridia bacterium]|nr:hypothetical protein [Clostridia bacterium]